MGPGLAEPGDLVHAVSGQLVAVWGNLPPSAAFLSSSGLLWGPRGPTGTHGKDGERRMKDSTLPWGSSHL